jgi:hypothetical protein
MFYPFTIGNLYRRRDVYRVIGIPEDTKGGNWDTGYARHHTDWFIFANVGVAGRTGHDYPNEWIGPDLLWYGKNNTTLHQPAIRSMLNGSGNVYIFMRADQNLPFVFVGCGTPQAIKDSYPDPILGTVPVSVLWSLSVPQHAPVAVQPFSHLVRESVSEAIYSVRSHQAEEFDSINLPEARKRVLRTITQRQGQPGFRYTLLSAYEGKCCISATDVPEALEAAHIIPYRETQTNTPENGLLLRADIHTLFDLGHLAIDSHKMKVLISPRLHDSEYAQFAGQTLAIPREKLLRPDHEALNQHREWAGL